MSQMLILTTILIIGEDNSYVKIRQNDEIWQILVYDFIRQKCENLWFFTILRHWYSKWGLKFHDFNMFKSMIFSVWDLKIHDFHGFEGHKLDYLCVCDMQNLHGRSWKLSIFSVKNDNLEKCYFLKFSLVVRST